MGFTKNILLIVSISSLLLLQINAIRIPKLLQDGVTKLCSTTTDPVLCVNTILPQMHGDFNPYKALELEILAAKNQVLKAVTVIDNLIKNPSTTKDSKESLTICKEQYAFMIDSITEAIAAVSKRNAWEANAKFSAVFSYRQSCELAFEPKLPPVSLTNEEAALKLVGGNVLDISKGLEDIEMSKKGMLTDATKTKITSPPSKCLNVVGTCNE
ncbi:hypothetical protein Lal_00043956 [Lupinus albus]|uniref:Putative pectinesterase inhibitor domain-containing protein n=1 Tax=Lupinus albus TaxID=3870 RepID=A0A6A5PF45_LUPAL|nr:putative pectinesterase inhibitor domain-containing protein [Lupinus albus]KAF1895310.1 hypothetical protein Lal_00043956 [Lupinus albus]